MLRPSLYGCCTPLRLSTYRRLYHRSLLTYSAVEGPTDLPLVTSTLPEYFATQVLSKHSLRPALICRSEHPRGHGGPASRNLGLTTHLAWDYEEFNKHILTVARGLVSLGVQKGDRVGVVMGNNR